MTVYYLESTTGNDADDGLSAANARATMASVLGIMAAGDTLYVSKVHSETPAAGITLTSPGTAASPVLIICVDFSALPPTAVSTGAVLNPTGANSITFNGYAISDGVLYGAGSGISNGQLQVTQATSMAWRFKNNELKLAGNNASSRINLGASGNNIDSFIDLDNVPMRFANASQGILPRGRIRWKNTTNAINGTVPTTLILVPSTSNGVATDFYISGVDLSALNTTLVALQANQSRIILEGCKLHSSLTISSGSSSGAGGNEIELVNCDSADTNKRRYKFSYLGEFYQEETIVRASGANDGLGSYSRKLVSSANVGFYRPFYSDWFYYYNTTVGSSITVEIEIVNDGTTLTDAEVWMELDAMLTSGFPIYTRTTDRATDYFATPTNQTSSSVTWTTTGLSSPVTQKLSVTVTPTKEGWVRARVAEAKATKTIYACPKILSSSSRQVQNIEGVWNEGAGSGSGINRHPGMGGGFAA